MGNPGAGQATKVVNQAIVGVGFALMTEAVLLAEALGLDTSLVPRALAGGLADGAMLQRIFPAIAARDFTPPLGYVRQLAKDLKAVHHTSTALGCALPLVENATLRFSAYADDGGAQADSRSLILREGPADRSR